MRATTLTPRSWPSSPTLATNTRPAAIGLNLRRLDVTAEDARQAAHDLAQRRVGRHGVDEDRHQVDLGIGGRRREALERRRHGPAVAALPDLVEALDLAGFVFLGDAQQFDACVAAVAFGEAVHADHDPLAG